MHKLLIKKLGPIQKCELTIKPYTVLTGYQASGKSTIAKAIYFFRTIKDDIFQIIQKNNYFNTFSNNTTNKVANLRGDFESSVRTKFLNTFGTSYSMDANMVISYQYSENTYIKISLKCEEESIARNFVWVDYSNNIREFLTQPFSSSNFTDLMDFLSDLFDDPFETVYIPAGRSILTVLGSQFNYFYYTMNDAQKHLLDACTRDYMERVMKLRPQFDGGLEGLLYGNKYTVSEQDCYKEALNIIKKIIKGKYTISDGEERIWIDDDRYVKINFASSGQQEVIWIVNLLFYYLTLKKKVFFIIEEPESNLFPESQKFVVELISLVFNSNNSVLITTHSPYVLGEINNMIYAGAIGKKAKDRTEKIVSHNLWIDYNQFDALFVKNGTTTSCLDEITMQIDNALLDQISCVINKEFDSLFNVNVELEENR